MLGQQFMISSFSKLLFNKTMIHKLIQKYASKSTKEWLKMNLKIDLKSIQMQWDNLEDCNNTKY